MLAVDGKRCNAVRDATRCDAMRYDAQSCCKVAADAMRGNHDVMRWLKNGSIPYPAQCDVTVAATAMRTRCNPASISDTMRDAKLVLLPKVRVAAGAIMCNVKRCTTQVFSNCGHPDDG